MNTRGKVARPDGVEESLLFDNQLCFKLHTTSRVVIRGYRPLLEQIDLTYPQYLVMLVLREWHASPPEQPTVEALDDRLLLDSGTLTPSFKRLEQPGLVGRRRVSHDEWEVYLVLTVSGITLCERVIPLRQQLACGAGLDLNEMLDLHQHLGGLLSRLRLVMGGQPSLQDWPVARGEWAPAVEDGLQFVAVEGLGQVAVHAGGTTALALVRQSVGG